MRRISIAVAVVSMCLGACTGGYGGDGGASVAPSQPASTAATAATGVQAFCEHLDAFGTKLAEDLAVTDAVAAVQQDASSAAETLRADAEDLDGAQARAASDVIEALEALADWRPDDADSLDDLIGASDQVVAAFSGANC
jgi:hypothetical protein